MSSISSKNNASALMSAFAAQRNQVLSPLSFNPSSALSQVVDELTSALQQLQSGANPSPLGGRPTASGNVLTGTGPVIKQLDDLIKSLTSAVHDNDPATTAPGARPRDPATTTPGARPLDPAATSPGARPRDPSTMTPGARPMDPSSSSSPLPLPSYPNLPPEAASSLISGLKQELGAMLNKISEGVSSGSITQRELSHLMARANELSDGIKSASADGQLSLVEALQLRLKSSQVAQKVSSKFENQRTAPMAGFNPVAQTEASQLGGMGEGVLNGSISMAELGKLVGGQKEIAKAARDIDSMGDLSKVQAAQQMLGVELLLTRLGKMRG